MGRRETVALLSEPSVTEKFYNIDTRSSFEAESPDSCWSPLCRRPPQEETSFANLMVTWKLSYEFKTWVLRKDPFFKRENLNVADFIKKYWTNFGENPNCKPRQDIN